MRTAKILDITEHFSNRSNIYDAFGTWVNNDTILSAITSFIPESQNKPIIVVDLGAGTGAVSKYILQEYPFEKSIIAVDICADMLDKIAEPAICRCVASLESLPFVDDTFDVAVSRQCLHYIEHLGQAIHEIKRVLNNNGVFILSQIVPLETQSKEYWSKVINFRQPLRKQYYSEKDWIDAFLSVGFTLRSVKRYSHRGSVKEWGSKYNISDSALIDEYKRLLLEAPSKFADEYNVSQKDDDVQYDSFWFVAKFQIE